MPTKKGLYDQLSPHYRKIKEIYSTMREENAFFRTAGFPAWFGDDISLEELITRGRLELKLKSQKTENPVHYRLARIISLPETGYSAQYSFFNIKALLR